MEDKIRIRCTPCNTVFRERGSRIRQGFELNCPQCNRLMMFDSSSEDLNIRKAFRAAKALRVARAEELDAAPRRPAAASDRWSTRS